MFDLGFQELIVIFIVAMIVFGPKRLPEIGQKIGGGLREIKRAMTDFKSEIDRESDDAQRDLKLDDFTANAKKTPPAETSASIEPDHPEKKGPCNV